MHRKRTRSSGSPHDASTRRNTDSHGTRAATRLLPSKPRIEGLPSGPAPAGIAESRQGSMSRRWRRRVLMTTSGAAAAAMVVALAGCSDAGDAPKPSPEPLVTEPAGDVPPATVPAETKPTDPVPGIAELPAEIPVTVEPSHSPGTGENETGDDAHTHGDGVTHTH